MYSFSPVSQTVWQGSNIFVLGFSAFKVSVNSRGFVPSWMVEGKSPINFLMMK